MLNSSSVGKREFKTAEVNSFATSLVTVLVSQFRPREFVFSLLHQKIYFAFRILLWPCEQNSSVLPNIDLPNVNLQISVRSVELWMRRMMSGSISGIQSISQPAKVSIFSPGNELASYCFHLISLQRQCRCKCNKKNSNRLSYSQLGSSIES